MSFVRLAQSGFFNGLSFHRVVPGFVVQGGDPRGDGYGGPGFSVRCEYNQRPYGRGALGMALSGKDTGGSQFFIALEPQPHLDGSYTQFGQVLSGMDVLEKIRPGDVIDRIDIDGTLLNSRREISPRNHAAIAAAGAAGVRIALVTGRRYPAAKTIADLLPGRPTLVLHNGGLVIEESVAIRVRPLARSSAIAVLTFAKSVGADPVVHFGQAGEGLLYVENASPSHTLLAYYLSRSHPDVRVVQNLEAAVAGKDEDPLQVMFGGSMREMSALAVAIEERGLEVSALRTVYPKDDLSLIDVVDPAVDKSEALGFLCARWGAELGEVLAIGDNWNDRKMLLAAGKGCVMGNADPELQALGLEVIPGNDEDGVAWAVERFVLPGAAGIKGE